MKQILAAFSFLVVLVLSASANAVQSSPAYDYPALPSYGEFLASAGGDIFNSAVWLAAKQTLPVISWDAVHGQFEEKEVNEIGLKADPWLFSGFTRAGNRVYKRATAFQGALISYNAYFDALIPEINDMGFHGQQSKTTVPEPMTMLMFGTGLAGLASLGRKKIKYFSVFKEKWTGARQTLPVLS